MKPIAASVLILPAIIIPGLAIRIVQGNDDGWAELYTRSFHNVLSSKGHQVVLSAPAQDMSGQDSRDEDPKKRRAPCHYESCPPNSGTHGHNESRPELNWVNSYPVTAIRYGIRHFGPQLWSGEGPDFAVSGPNVGHNLGPIVLQGSGTVGAAAYAAREAQIPAMAFSAPDNGRMRWDFSPVPKYSILYANIAANITQQIINYGSRSGKPYLPEDVFLNINFPRYQNGCNKPSDFKFILTRITLPHQDDVQWCDRYWLPLEEQVMITGQCYVSISIGNAKNLRSVHDLAKQRHVLDALKDILSCFDRDHVSDTNSTNTDKLQQEL